MSTHEEAVEAARNAIAKADITFACCDASWQLSVARKAIAAYQAALSPTDTATAGRVEIKPLEWKEYNFHTRMVKTICGYYEVQYRAFKDGVTRWYWKRTGDPLTTSFDNEDEAKAAAQADYETRIHSALTHPQPSNGDEVERLREAFEVLNKNVGLELTWGEVDGWPDDCRWRVHRRNGGRNDTEWKLMATGDTAQEALLNARAALKGSSHDQR